MADLEGIKLAEGNGYLYFDGKKFPITDFSETSSNGRATQKLIYGSMNNNNNEENKSWSATMVLVEEQMRDVLQFARDKQTEFQIVWVHNATNDTVKSTYEGCLRNDNNLTIGATAGGTCAVSGTYKKVTTS